MKRFWRNVVAVVGVAVGLAPSGPAHADVITYTVDPDLSSLTLSGTWGSIAIAPVLAGEDLITSYSGALLVDRDAVQNTLTISGGTIVAQNTAGLFAPYSTPADYGFDKQNLAVLAAIRGFSFSLMSQLITSPSSFDASSVTAIVDSGQVDFAIRTQTGNNPVTFDETDGSTPLGDGFTLGSGLASIADTQGLETLTIPIQADYEVQVNGEPLQLHFSGAIVATAPVPEPMTVFFMLGLSASLIRRGTRRR